MLCLCACGSCQGANLGLPVSCYRETLKESCYPLSFSHLRGFPPWVQITEMIPGNLQSSLCSVSFGHIDITQWSTGMKFSLEGGKGAWRHAAPPVSPGTAHSHAASSLWDQYALLLGNLPALVCLPPFAWKCADIDAAPLLLLEVGSHDLIIKLV